LRFGHDFTEAQAKACDYEALMTQAGAKGEGLSAIGLEQFQPSPDFLQCLRLAALCVLCG
jgi:hypothetical protein